MPLTAKGNEILAAMKKEYGDKKGEEVFYASKNAGKITGVDSDERADAGYEIWEDPELKGEKYRFFVVNKGTKLPAITKSFASREEAERKKKELESRGDGLPPDSDVNPINLGIDCDAVQTKLDSMAEQINSLGSRAAGILRRMDANEEFKERQKQRFYKLEQIQSEAKVLQDKLKQIKRKNKDKRYIGDKFSRAEEAVKKAVGSSGLAINDLRNGHAYRFEEMKDKAERALSEANDIMSRLED